MSTERDIDLLYSLLVSDIEQLACEILLLTEQVEQLKQSIEQTSN